MTITTPIYRTLLALTLLWAAWSASAQEVKFSRVEKQTESAIAGNLLVDIYKRAGLSPKLVSLPAARGNAMALAGELDGEAARVQAYANNNPTLQKVEPAFYYLTTTVFAKADKGIKVTSREDLKKYKVGIARGIAHTAAATEGLPSVQVAGDASALFQMLDAGRIDVALDAGVNGIYFVKKLKLTGIVPVGDIARLDLYNMLAPGKKDVAAKVSATIKSLKDSGELNKLASKHEEDFFKSGVEP